MRFPVQLIVPDLYHRASHAFLSETRSAVHPDAARQTWARRLALPQRTLKS